MSITLSAFANRVYRRLNEAANTDIPALQSGTNSTPTLTAIQGVVDAWNEVAGQFARTCFPIICNGTYASYPVGEATFNLASLTSISTGVDKMWLATEIQYNGVSLDMVGYDFLVLWTSYSGGIFQGTTGTPAYAANLNDAGDVVINPRPTDSHNMTVGGYGLPPVAIDGTSTTAWLPDDLLEVFECRVAALLGEKNEDDPTLAGRVPEWNQLYNIRRQEIWNRLDPMLRRWVYPTSPIPQGK